MQRKYPWEEWFSNEITVIVRGVDYFCSQSNMVQSIRNKASSLGLKLRITDTGTEIVMVIVGRRGNNEVPHTNKAPVDNQRKSLLAKDGKD